MIVLVITIIVMIILATAIILSLNGSGIIGKANKATADQNAQVEKETITLAYSTSHLEKLDDPTKTTFDVLETELKKVYGNKVSVQAAELDKYWIEFDEPGDANKDGSIEDGEKKTYTITKNGKVIEGKLITFSINTNIECDCELSKYYSFECEAYYGMTWEKWCDSDMLGAENCECQTYWYQDGGAIHIGLVTNHNENCNMFKKTGDCLNPYWSLLGSDYEITGNDGIKEAQIVDGTNYIATFWE